MPIVVQCESCRKGLKVPDHYAGQTIRCPACKAPVEIPIPLPVDEEADTAFVVEDEEKPASAPISPLEAFTKPITPHCRTCGSEIPENAVACMQCGILPKHGTAYCYYCGAATSPLQTVVCVSCGSAPGGPVIPVGKVVKDKAPTSPMVADRSTRYQTKITPCLAETILSVLIIIIFVGGIIASLILFVMAIEGYEALFAYIGLGILVGLPSLSLHLFWARSILRYLRIIATQHQ